MTNVEASCWFQEFAHVMMVVVSDSSFRRACRTVALAVFVSDGEQYTQSILPHMLIFEGSIDQSYGLLSPLTGLT